MLRLLLVAVFLMHSNRAQNDADVALNVVLTTRMEKQQLLSICNRGRQQAGMSPVSWSPKLENQALQLALTCPKPGTSIGEGQSCNALVRTAGSYQAYPSGFQAIQKVGCAKADCSQQFGSEYGAGIVLVCIYDNVVDDIIEDRALSQPMIIPQSQASYGQARPSSASYGTQTSQAGSYNTAPTASRVSHQSAASDSSSCKSTSGSSYMSPTGSTGYSGSGSIPSPSTSGSSYISQPLTPGSGYTSPTAKMNEGYGGSIAGGPAYTSGSYMGQPPSSSAAGSDHSSFDDSDSLSSEEMMDSGSPLHELLLDGIPVVSK